MVNSASGFESGSNSLSCFYITADFSVNRWSSSVDGYVPLSRAMPCCCHSCFSLSDGGKCLFEVRIANQLFVQAFAAFIILFWYSAFTIVSCCEASSLAVTVHLSNQLSFGYLVSLVICRWYHGHLRTDFYFRYRFDRSGSSHRIWNIAFTDSSGGVRHFVFGGWTGKRAIFLLLQPRRLRRLE